MRVLLQLLTCKAKMSQVLRCSPYFPSHLMMCLSTRLCLDESMFHWYGRGLPHVSFFPRKRKSNGSEVKSVYEYLSGTMARVDIQEAEAMMSQLLEDTKLKAGLSWIKLTAARVMRLTDRCRR